MPDDTIETYFIDDQGRRWDWISPLHIFIFNNFVLLFHLFLLYLRCLCPYLFNLMVKAPSTCQTSTYKSRGPTHVGCWPAVTIRLYGQKDRKFKKGVIPCHKCMCRWRIVVYTWIQFRKHKTSEHLHHVKFTVLLENFSRLPFMSKLWLYLSTN
jgi:hypothetical protein